MENHMEGHWRRVLDNFSQIGDLFSDRVQKLGEVLKAHGLTIVTTAPGTLNCKYASGKSASIRVELIGHSAFVRTELPFPIMSRLVPLAQRLHMPDVTIHDQSSDLNANPLPSGSATTVFELNRDDVRRTIEEELIRFASNVAQFIPIF
jgi:hypothetical protein